MLDKYTIFDNFDKLDLSPVAGRFNTLLPTAPGENQLITLELGSLAKNLIQTLDGINYVKANETIYTDLGGARYLQQTEPYNITPQNFGSFGTYVPDMYRYVTKDSHWIPIYK